jgi:hypothetical protein
LVIRVGLFARYSELEMLLLGFMFGELIMINDKPVFGNLMLTKLMAK